MGKLLYDNSNLVLLSNMVLRNLRGITGTAKHCVLSDHLEYY